jgi:hypothetical protein
LSLVEDQIHNFRLPDMQPRLRLKHLPHLHAILLLVALRTWTPHRRPARRIEQPELNPNRIGHLAHNPAQRINFAHQVPLGHAAHRRVAAHLRNQVQVHRNQRSLQPHARRGHRRLAPRMTRAHNHHIVLFRKCHPS